MAHPAPLEPRAASARSLRWDLFCRVVDNFGDIGVSWRLAAQLAARGDHVRLFVDDASALEWMAPQRERLAPALGVRAWPQAGEALQPAPIVVEAFGCNPPASYVAAMHSVDPVWINLEYLSAEGYVARSHALPSPRADGLRKWFFYPGFTARTGGLLREPGLLQRRASFDRDAWLASLGLQRTAGERVASLFCYDSAAAVGNLVASLAEAPTLLLLTPGPAQRLVRDGIAPHLRLARLPWLDQAGFDHLLWASDLNCVRGEDSLVRALWAAAPFLWQTYPQDDGAHAAKLQALLASMGLPEAAAQAQLAWNGLSDWPGLPAMAPWQAAVQAFRSTLAQQEDLATQLRRFASERLLKFAVSQEAPQAAPRYP